MVDLIKPFEVFPKGEANRYQLDAVQLTTYLKRLPPGFPRSKPRFLPTPEFLATKPKFSHRDGQQILTYSARDLVVQQALGHHAGGGGAISSSFKLNIIRRSRASLVRSGVISSAIPEVAGARRGDDNFIDPGELPARIDLHALSMESLMAAVAEVRDVYRSNLDRVFAMVVDPSSIDISLTAAELTWDRRCDVARHALTAFRQPWAEVMLGAASALGLPDPTWSAREATEHRETYAPIGAQVHSVIPRVLRADAAKGGGFKLYPKHPRLLRFEAEITQARAQKVLKRRIRLDDVANVEADLKPFAERAYAAMLQAQANLTNTSMVDLIELVERFMLAGKPRKVRPILEAFLAGTKFFNDREKYRKPLNKLRKSGCAIYVGDGAWARGPEVAKTFALIERLLTHRRGEA